MRRRERKSSMHNDKKKTCARAVSETAGEWIRSACLPPLPPIFFIRYRGRFDIPRTDDSALSAFDTDARPAQF